MGPRRRGVPTIFFREALPRRLRVRRPPSFQMVGSARRSGPKIQAQRAVSAGCKGGFASKASPLTPPLSLCMILSI
jgi:hypothetical protein